MRFIFCFALLVLASDIALSQKILTLTNVKNPNRTVKIKKNNGVTVLYSDSTRKSRWKPLLYSSGSKNLHYVEGGVISINDSAIFIRRALGKPVSVKLNSIAQIRKNNIGLAFLIGGGVGIGLLPLYRHIPVHPYVVLGAATVGTLIVTQNVLLPLKNVDEKYYQSHNQWKMDVLDDPKKVVIE